MTSRREMVVLELVDQFTGPAARATASARLLRNSIDDIDHTSNDASTTIIRSSRDIDGLGTSSRRAGPEIDRLSGRLGLARDAVLTLGPAFVPIGAVAIPALVGLTGALGAAVLGAGVAVGAFQGVGDAVKALSKAELEPTAANLQAAREQLESLSPAAASFVTQIHALIPALKSVRDSAAEGMFPGLSQGIDDLERRLPIIQRIASSIGEALGGLAADGGASLSSGRWGPFLRFIEDEAPGAITSLGHIVGDLSHGVAALFMAFDPLSDGVIDSLERGADAFDRWAQSLDGSQGFEDFVDYVQESGPKVADALGAIGNAVVQILTAVAPLGGPSLKVIETFADALALVAGSDIGSPLFTAAAAFALYNRGAAVAASLTTRLSTGLSGLSGAAKAGGAVFALEAIGAAAGELESRMDSAVPGVQELTATLLELGSAQSTAQLVEQVGSLHSALDALDDSGVQGFSNDLNELATSGGLVGNAFKGLTMTGFLPGVTNPESQRALREAKTSIEGIDQALAGLVTSAGPERADQAFQQLAASQNLTADETARLRELLPGYRDALAGVGNDAAIAADGVDAAAEATQRFSTALADLNGWLDKRAAIRGYRDDVVALAKGIQDGFGRKDVEQLDKTAASIAKVASSIKDKGIRADFLAGARSSLADLADNSAPKARAEIEKVIGKLDKFGVTRPPRPQLDVDGRPATRSAEEVGRTLRGLGRQVARPRVDADTKRADRGLRGTTLLAQVLGRQDPTVSVFANTSAATAALNGINNLKLRDKYITVHTRNAGVVPKSADGSTVPKDGQPYADRYLYMLAPGEEVISNRHGQADRHRSLLKAINAGRLADGGTADDDDDSKKSKPRRKRAVVVDEDDPRFGAPTGLKQRAAYFKDFEHDAKKALRKLESSLDHASATVDANKEAVDRETSARDQLQSSFDSLQSTIAGMFTSDLFTSTGDVFGSNTTTSDPISVLLSDIANSEQFDALFAGLQSRGLNGDALTAAAQGGVSGLQTVSAYDAGQLGQYQQLVATREQRAASSGQQVAQAQFGQALADQTTRLDQANAIAAEGNYKLDILTDAVRQQEKTVKAAGNAQESATKSLGSSVAKGKRSRKG